MPVTCSASFTPRASPENQPTTATFLLLVEAPSDQNSVERSHYMMEMGF